MTDRPDDSTELLNRGVAGDRAAIAELWGRHQDRLCRTVRLRMDRRLRSRFDVADVMQEAFVDFASRAGEYAAEPEVPFFVWLRFLVLQRLQAFHRHHLGAQMRDARREVTLDGGPTPRASSAHLAERLLGRFTSASQAAVRSERRRILQDVLNGMDDADREILALRHFEDLSNAEAARVLGVKESAASTRHVRALKRLRQLLEQTRGFFDGTER